MEDEISNHDLLEIALPLIGYSQVCNKQTGSNKRMKWYFDKEE